MPSAGALTAPVVGAISRNGRSGPKIDTATFILLDTGKLCFYSTVLRVKASTHSNDLFVLFMLKSYSFYP